MSEGTNHNDTHGDDLLERSIDALKQERMPSGLSDELLARTLSMLNPAHSHNERNSVVKRIFQMTFAQRIAAAVMLTIGALVLWFMFGLLGGGTVSYAQVAQQIKAAQTMSFKMTMTSPALPKPEAMTIYAKEPGMMRNEGTGGIVTISHREANKIRMLVLMEKMKQARAVELKLSDPIQAAAPDFVGQFRKLADQKGEELETREINGVRAKGFRINADGQVVSLWADPKTAQPMLVEMDVPTGGEEGGGKLVMSDFTFDTPLEESLFSLEPPKGYTLEQMDLGGITLDLEANVINALQVYADATDGKFPERLDDWGAYGKALAGKSKGGKVDAAAMQKVAGVGAISALLSNKKANVDYAYTGKDAKLGDKDTIVFWHRDKAKNTYRAIFADLTARDVSADAIPKDR